LEAVAVMLDKPALNWLIWAGAMTAMLGVLLNLILGLSRVLLAMGRRGDMPKATAKLNDAGTTPTVAVIAVGLFMTGLVFLGNVKTTWSFSAFTVLTYYAINNLAALQLEKEQRLYPRFFAICGLGSCLFLAYWVDWQIWCTGLGLILLGLIWHHLRQSKRNQTA
jgi:APA family basic amino acid/polyamine antiporter